MLMPSSKSLTWLTKVVAKGSVLTPSMATRMLRSFSAPSMMRAYWPKKPATQSASIMSMRQARTMRRPSMRTLWWTESEPQSESPMLLGLISEGRSLLTIMKMGTSGGSRRTVSCTARSAMKSPLTMTRPLMSARSARQRS